MSLRVGNSILAGSPIDKTDLNLANSPYTTNRILEIPQSIKLELNNGTLTLKDGSKVYVPNGFESDGTTPKFDIVTIDNDLSYTESYSGSALQRQMYYNYLTGGIFRGSGNISSGSTAPSTYPSVWYDTTNNKCWLYLSSSEKEQASLPLGIITIESGIKSIDQIFNGFGYIGSTMFALPGVKIQAPNGVNEDGTCKSNIKIQGVVGTTTFTTESYTLPIILRPASNNSHLTIFQLIGIMTLCQIIL